MKPLALVLVLCSSAFAIDYKKTDIFGSVGSDFTLAPRANATIGIGHRFQFKKNSAQKTRWEIMATYTYENNGNHGFVKTQYGAHSEAIGITRSIHLPGRFTSFAVVRGGATEYTAMDRDPRAFISGTYGFGIHIHYRYTLSFSESYTKTETKPTYFTTAVALSHGWWSVSANTNRTAGDYRCHVNLGISLSALMSGEHKEHPRVIQSTR